MFDVGAKISATLLHYILSLLKNHSLIVFFPLVFFRNSLLFLSVPVPCSTTILYYYYNEYCQGWAENDRGVSYVFGADVVTEFLERQDLDLIVRAHQVVEDGYQFFAGRKLVTLFSAPNYCGEFDNAGAMISIDENLMCSFQILKPSEKKYRYHQGGGSSSSSSCRNNNDQPQLL